VQLPSTDIACVPGDHGSDEGFGDAYPYGLKVLH